MDDNSNKVAVDIGSSALLVCRVSAYPPPSLTWGIVPNGGAIIGDGHHYETNTTVIEGDVIQAVLKINSITRKDYKNYSCTAINSLGEKRILISLQPKGKFTKKISITEKFLVKFGP